MKVTIRLGHGLCDTNKHIGLSSRQPPPTLTQHIGGELSMWLGFANILCIECTRSEKHKLPNTFLLNWQFEPTLRLMDI